MYFWEAVGGRGRSWEAVGGRGRPWGSDWLRKIWDSLTQLPRSIWANQSPTASHGLPRPPTASQIWPPMASHRFGLPQFVMWSLWANESLPRPHRSASQIWESDRPLTPRGYLTDFTAKRIASAGVRERPIGLSNLWGRSVRPWESGESDRPLTPRGYLTDFTAKRIASAGVRERPIGLSNLWGRSVRPWESDRTLAAEAMRLAVKSVRRARGWQHRPVCVRGRSDSQICEAVCVSCDLSESPKWEAVWEADRPLTLSGRCSPILGRSNAFSRGSDCIARCAWEADQPPTRPLTSDSQTDHTASHTASQITDRTLWQIWLCDRSDRFIS